MAGAAAWQNAGPVYNTPPMGQAVGPNSMGPFIYKSELPGEGSRTVSAQQPSSQDANSGQMYYDNTGSNTTASWPPQQQQQNGYFNRWSDGVEQPYQQGATYPLEGGVPAAVRSDVRPGERTRRDTSELE